MAPTQIQYRGLQVGPGTAAVEVDHALLYIIEFVVYTAGLSSLHVTLTEFGDSVVANYVCLSNFQLCCSPSTNLQTSVYMEGTIGQV